VTQAVIRLGLKAAFKELRLEPKLLNRGLRRQIYFTQCLSVYKEVLGKYRFLQVLNKYVTNSSNEKQFLFTVLYKISDI